MFWGFTVAKRVSLMHRIRVYLPFQEFFTTVKREVKEPSGPSTDDDVDGSFDFEEEAVASLCPIALAIFMKLTGKKKKGLLLTGNGGEGLRLFFSWIRTMLYMKYAACMTRARSCVQKVMQERE